jgi:His/Glu/Gln/Arg/opine family amino acid ABC transporter permease subunit
VQFDFGMMAQVLPTLLSGLKVTLELAVSAMVLALIFGLVVVIVQLSRIFLLASLAGGFVQLMRNTPVLVQMYFFYFGFAAAGLHFSAFESGLIALALHNTAYIAVIYRAGIDGVGRPQREAALALGMLPRQAFRIAIFPQAVRLVVPPLTNQLIVLVKDTSLVSTISVTEMTFRAQMLTESTAAVYEIFTTLALLYLAVNGVLALAMRLVEWRLRPVT